jgi:hypothetical protein
MVTPANAEIYGALGTDVLFFAFCSDSYIHSFFVVRSKICRVLGLYLVLMYVYRLYQFLFHTFFCTIEFLCM